MLLEKYRPHTIDDIIGQEHIIGRMKERLANGGKNMPHMLFAGPPGTGKTTLAKIIGKNIFGDMSGAYMLDMNASDERGIDTIRKKVKDFIKNACVDFPFRIVFLDEADNLVKDAQAALRRVMEDYAKICRFILSCNYSSKIIEPIQDRCASFRFKLLSKEDIYKMLMRVRDGENIPIKNDVLQTIATSSKGSMRKAINYLTELASYGPDAEKHIDSVITTIDSSKIMKIIGFALKMQIQEMDREITRLYFNEAMDVQEIIETIYYALLDNKGLNDKTKVAIFSELAHTERACCDGANPLIQLKCFFAWLCMQGNRK